MEAASALASDPGGSCLMEDEADAEDDVRLLVGRDEEEGEGSAFPIVAGGWLV